MNYFFLFAGGLGEVFSLVKTGIVEFVEFQVSWTCNTSDSNSLPASNILSRVGWVSNVSIEFGSFFTTDIWTLEGGGWLPFLGGDAFISSAVQTLIAFLTEFQAHWEASLTVG